MGFRKLHPPLQTHPLPRSPGARREGKELGKAQEKQQRGGVGWDVTHTQPGKFQFIQFILLMESVLALLLITRQNSVSHFISQEENMNPGILAAPTAREGSQLQETPRAAPRPHPGHLWYFPRDFHPDPGGPVNEGERKQSHS